MILAKCGIYIDNLENIGNHSPLEEHVYIYFAGCQYIC